MSDFSNPQTIRATTPARIDLAGGTLDIYPLYLFEEFGVTVNAAIDLGSEATVALRDDDNIVLRANDIDTEQHAGCLEALDLDAELPLLARIARYYLKGFDRGVTITTRNKAPKGSGLGASSCLLIALSGALNELTGKGLSKQEMILIGSELEAQVIRIPTGEPGTVLRTVYNPALHELIRVGSEIEAAVIEIPTGKQDYFAAAYGGVNAIWFETGKDSVEPLGEEAAKELTERVVLSFTGVSHFSGTSNWAMMKRYIDNAGDTRDRMRAIKQTAIDMRAAIKNGNWSDFAQLIDQEWQNRRGLAKGVSTAKIERIMADAKDAGALSSKICGAGGGGCMITIIDPGTRQKVEAAIRSAKGQVLAFEVQTQGLTITKG